MIIAAKEKSVVFDGFPLTENLYLADVRPLVQQVILRYGMSEWRAAVLTNELHGHLGIYALLGVKMGVLALEQFAVGDQELQVISYAGHQPPLSCLNDGLQVATGATLGHGTIRISDHRHTTPEALFAKGRRSVRISLKGSVTEQIISDIARGRTKYGVGNPSYWEYVRHLALDYWLSLDRHEIFEVEVVPSEKKS